MGKTITFAITTILCLLFLSVVAVSFVQPLHIPFLGDAAQRSVDKGVTCFLITGNENGLDVLSDAEAAHMYDVKWLIDLTFLFGLVFGLFSVLLYDKRTHRKIRFAPLGFFVVLVILIVSPFAQLFDRFHEVFFPQGNYTFAFDSMLIQTYPATFFQAALIMIAVLYLIGSIIFAYVHVKKSKK